MITYIHKEQHKEISELFDICCPDKKRHLTKDMWNWRYHDTYYPSVTALEYDGSKLVGHYAVRIIPINLKGSVGSLSYDTMIHPDYRRRGIFIKLAREVYAKLKDDGVSFVYGFPNTQSSHGMYENLGWSKFENLYEYEIAFEGDCRPETRKLDILTTIPVNSAGYDKNIERLISRSYDYLRFRLTNYPRYTLGQYGILTPRTPKDFSNPPSLIYKVFYGEKEPRFHVLSVVGESKEEENKYFTRLLLDAIRLAGCLGISKISIWGSKDFSVAFPLEIVSRIHVGGGCLSLQEGLDTKDVWTRLDGNLEMLDSDIY